MANALQTRLDKIAAAIEALAHPPPPYLGVRLIVGTTDSVDSLKAAALARIPAADRQRVRFVVRRMVEPIEVNGEPNQ